MRGREGPAEREGGALRRARGGSVEGVCGFAYRRRASGGSGDGPRRVGGALAEASREVRAGPGGARRSAPDRAPAPRPRRGRDTPRRRARGRLVLAAPG